MLSDIIDLLSPLCETVPDRQALLREAVGLQSGLLNEIVFEGATPEFIVNMLAILAQRRGALDALINVIKKHVDKDLADELEAYRSELHTWSYTGASKAELYPEVSSAVEIIDIRGNAEAGNLNIGGTQHIYGNIYIRQDKSAKPRQAPFMAPDLPPSFVERAAPLAELKSRLLEAERSDPIAITTALQGAGGFGKTTLATALCHDRDVQTTFADGVLWVTLGETPDVRGSLMKLYAALTGERPTFIDVEDAANQLAGILANKNCLIVIDDVWNSAHLRPFLRGGIACARLITTRDASIAIHNHAQSTHVDEMTSDESILLLRNGLDGLTWRELHQLAARLGEWPLMLELANAMMRERITIFGDDSSKALQWLTHLLNLRGIQGIHRDDIEQRKRDAAGVMSSSLELLDENQRQKLYLLSIFREDRNIPLSSVSLLWKIDRFNTEEFVQHFARLSLLKFAPMNGTIRLHDVIREYLLTQVTNVVQAHHELMREWGKWHALPDEYAWHNISYHLHEAKRLDMLRSLLLDYSFLQAKLKATDVNALIADCEMLPQDEVIRLLKSALSMSAHLISLDKAQLPSQLYARLMSYRNTQSDLAKLLEACHTTSEPILYPMYQTFHPAGGALLRTLAGHRGWVNALALSGPIAVTAADDSTLKVWNWQTGALLHTLESHSMSLHAVALSGVIAVSSGADGKLKVWNWQTGALLQTLDGHRGRVNAIALSGTMALTASDDTTLKVWNWQTGAFLQTLEGHSMSVRAVALADEIAISASDDTTLKVWNWQTGAFLQTLEGHSMSVRAVALADEIAISASDDTTLKVWNWRTGKLLRTLEGHRGKVKSVALSGATVISASDDTTLKVWNWQRGRQLLTLEGHIREVRAVGLAGTIAVSASADETLKVWNWQTRETVSTLEGHQGWVKEVALSGAIAVSASDDGTLKVWNWQTGALVRTLQNHRGWVKALALFDDIVVSADDTTLKVWNWQTGTLLRQLFGHKRRINAVALAGKIIMSASDDGTLKVWNWQTEILLHTLDGHTRSVNSVAMLGAIVVSASSDETLKVWNWQTGVLLHTLDGHTRSVNSVAISEAIALSASDDGTLKVWNWQTGKLLRTLEDQNRSMNTVALSGHVALIASSNRTLTIWNWQTNKVLATFFFDASQYSVDIGPDASVIVSGGSDGRVHFLRPNPVLLRLLQNVNIG